MKRFFAITTLVLSAVLFFAAPVFAQEDTSIIGRINAQVPCMKTGSCTSLDSILAVFAQISQWLLGIAGSVMLLMFVWGGAEWVFSAGESGRIKSGKGKMTNAVIGIVIMFGALALVRSIRVGLIGGEAVNVPNGGMCAINSDCTSRCCFGGTCQATNACEQAKASSECTVSTTGAAPAADAKACPKQGQMQLICVARTGGNQCVSGCVAAGGQCQRAACAAPATEQPGDKVQLCGDASQYCCKTP